MPRSDTDLWTCPECGQRFTTANVWHSCGSFTLDELFAGCHPIVRETYGAFEKMALEVAPFHVIPQRTRVTFQLRTRCAGGSPMKSYFRASFVLRQVVPDPRFVSIQPFKPDQNVHHLALRSPADVDEQVREWLTLATDYGEQRHP